MFGEVPLVLGTPFPAALRAAEPSRVLRLEAKDFHVIAAVAPDVMFFANHPCSVTLLVRGDSLAKSMSYYRIEQTAR